MTSVTLDTLLYLPSVYLLGAVLSLCVKPQFGRFVVGAAGVFGAGVAWNCVQALATAGSFSAQGAGGYIGARASSRLLSMSFMLDPATAPLLLGLACVLGVGLVGLAVTGFAARATGALCCMLAAAVVVLTLSPELPVVLGAFMLVGLVAVMVPLTVVGARPAGDAAIRAFAVHRLGDAAFVLCLMALSASLGGLSFERLFTVPLDVDPWQRLSSGLFAGLAHRTAWFWAGALLAVAISSRLGLLCWPLVRDLTASAQLPGPVSGLVHAGLMGSGLVVLLRLSPVLALAPEASDALLWAAILTSLLAALVAAAARDVLRLDPHLLPAATAPVVVLTVLGQPVAATLSALVVLGLSLVLPWTMAALTAAVDKRDPLAMTGLEHVIPRVHTTRLLATTALAALPPFAGWVALERALEAALLSPKVTTPMFACLVAGAIVVGAASWRVLHLVFSGPKSDVTPPHSVVVWPALGLALVIPALALLDLPTLLLRQLLEIDYDSLLRTFMTPALPELASLQALYLPAQVAPKVAPSTFLYASLAAGFVAYLVSALLWRSRASLRPGPPPGLPLRQVGVVSAVADKVAGLAGRDSPVARTVGDAVDRLSRIVASNLVPLTLSIVLQRLPGWGSALLGFVLRTLQNGGAQAALVIATAWLGWIYALSK